MPKISATLQTPTAKPANLALSRERPSPSYAYQTPQYGSGKMTSADSSTPRDMSKNLTFRLNG
jgi:hypothetical protein